MICSGSTPAPLCQWKVKITRDVDTTTIIEQIVFLLYYEWGILYPFMNYVCSCLISCRVHSSHMKKWLAVMFCCVCFPTEGWHTGTLDCWIQNWVLLPHIGWKLQNTEPTKTTNIANKTAPLASRCLYPMISILITLWFLFVWLESGRKPILLGTVVQNSNFKDMSQRMGYRATTWPWNFFRIEVPRNVAVSPRSWSLFGRGLPPRRRFGMHETWGFCGWKHHRISPLFTLLRVAMGLGQWCCLKT